MSQNCLPLRDERLSGVSRRDFFRLAGATAMGLAFSGVLRAAAPAVPPKPQNVISPDEALERLLKGNRRYVEGAAKRRDFTAGRPALVAGQNPFAAVLSCADSRVAPEYVFDTGRGDLFVCRVAGNFANTESIASLEYGVAVLGVPFILVLGHENCGAVSSTISAVRNGTKYPGHIPSLVKAIRPAVEAELHESGDLLANSTRENVLLAVEKLKACGPILKEAVAKGKLKIGGGVYELGSGRVKLV